MSYMSRMDSRWTLNPPQPAQPADFYGPHPEVPGLSYYVIEIPGEEIPESVSGYFKAETAWLIAAAPSLLDFARNVAGLDNSALRHMRDHGKLVQLIEDWRVQARAMVDKAEGHS